MCTPLPHAVLSNTHTLNKNTNTKKYHTITKPTQYEQLKTQTTKNTNNSTTTKTIKQHNKHNKLSSTTLNHTHARFFLNTVKLSSTLSENYGLTTFTTLNLQPFVHVPTTGSCWTSNTPTNVFTWKSGFISYKWVYRVWRCSSRTVQVYHTHMDNQTLKRRQSLNEVCKSVTEYEYKNTDFIHKKCQPRIFCLQKLRSLNVSAAVSRVLTFSWKAKMSWLKLCCKVVGERQEYLSQLYELVILDNSHVLAKCY